MDDLQNKLPKDLKFEDKIAFIRKSMIGVPRLIEIDLSVVVTDLPMDVSGNVFYILEAPDGTSYIRVRFNERNQSQIPFYQQVGLETPFYRIFLTVPAGQTGTMYILVATEAPEFLQIIDNRAATSADLSDMLAELRGDTTFQTVGNEITVGVAAVQVIAANANRKACNVQSKSSNSDPIYIGFDNTVTSARWVFELMPGESLIMDDYRGPIYGISTAANQLVGWGEW